MAENLIIIAEQHVAKARIIVAKQRARIERLRAVGCDTLDAEQTLGAFESSLSVFEHHRAWLRQRPDMG